jgi:alpha-ketoglutarate-dependent taurine dioxygenase
MKFATVEFLRIISLRLCSTNYFFVSSDIMEIELIKEHFGVKIRVANFAELNKSAKLIRSLVLEKKLVVFENLPPIKVRDIEKYLANFGKVWEFWQEHFRSREECLSYVAYRDNICKQGDRSVLVGPQNIMGDMYSAWHQDQRHTDLFFHGRSLYALEVDSGQESKTNFSCLVHVAKNLPPDMLAALKRINLEIEYPLGRRERKKIKLFVTHPLLDIELLTFDTNFYNLISIDPISWDEFDGLKKEIIAELDRPDNVYAHRWKPGDWLLFDNAQLAHSRDRLDPLLRRTLCRTSWCWD